LYTRNPYDPDPTHPARRTPHTEAQARPSPRSPRRIELAQQNDL
jgi:hypothetical protein